MAACALTRDDGESDIDFMVRCKVAETNTCAEPVVDEPEVIEDHDDSDQDDAGDGW